MRCWRTRDGRYLVERASVSLGVVCLGFRDPAGQRIATGHDYLLRDGRGAVVEEFVSGAGYAQEVAAEHTYVVEGAALRCWTCESIDLQPGELASDQLVLPDLEALDGEPPFPISLEEALAERRGIEEERAAHAAASGGGALLRSEEQLPELPGAGPLEAAIVCEADRDIVVRVGGAEVWRERVSNGGRGRPAVIEALLRRKYGARLGACRIDVDYDWLFGT